MLNKGNIGLADYGQRDVEEDKYTINMFYLWTAMRNVSAQIAQSCPVKSHDPLANLAPNKYHEQQYFLISDTKMETTVPLTYICFN